MKTLILSIIASVALGAALGCDPYESPAATDDSPPSPPPVAPVEVIPDDEAPDVQLDESPNDVDTLNDTIAQPPSDADDRAADLSPAEVEFINKAAIGSMFEVQSAELAIDEASEVQDVAMMIRDDHQQLNEQLRDIAQQHGITLPTTLDSEHRDMLAQIRDAQPQSMADEFIAVHIDAHKETISLFERAEMELPKSDLRTFASNALPTLREHLQVLQDIQQTPVE